MSATAEPVDPIPALPPLRIHEVCVRDGFQIEPVFVPTDRKVELINALGRTGLSKIEVTSFSSPKAIPALADAEEVMHRIERVPGVEYAALVPNVRGAQRALACDVDELNLVMSASASHNQANLRMSQSQSLAQFSDIVVEVAGRAQINASLSTAFGCPFDGDVPTDQVLGLVQRFVDLGITRVALCDTTGMAHPAQVRRLFGTVIARWPRVTFTAHFHDTRAMGLANALAALDVGVLHFDASLGGLGGCPFAPGASGNIATEDLVYLLRDSEIGVDVDLEGAIAAARVAQEVVGHDLPSSLLRAGDRILGT